ncbi:MAG: response regulator [Cyanobacteriota bacterium]
MNTFNILIVDDDSVIRKSLVNYLTRFHKADYKLSVHSAESTKQAKEFFASNKYNLAIVDINMPDESGFNLIEFINEKYPDTKSAMITAYKVEDYLKLCKEKSISNIIVKTAPFNFNELSQIVNGLLVPDKYLFGLHNYLPENTDLNYMTIDSSDSITNAQIKLRDCMKELNINNIELLSIALLEAMTNALYHAPHNDSGERKYERDQKIGKLIGDEVVDVIYGWNEDIFGISVIDKAGRLSKENVLYWLNRNITGANILDATGRGLYLMHCIVDRLIINIKTNEKTELIFLIYLKDVYSGHKPIYINQI